MEGITWVVAEGIFAGINIALVYLFAQAFLKKKSEVYNVWKISVVLIAFAIKFYTSYHHIENIFIISSVSITTAFFIGMICFQAKLHWVGISAAFSFLAGGISELLAAFVVTGFQAVTMDNVMQLNIYRLQGRTLTYLFLLLVIVLVGRFRTGDIKSLNFKLMSVLCAPPLASILIVHQFANHIMDTVYLPNTSELITMLSIIAVNIFIFILIEGLIRQNEKNRALLLITTQSEAQQKYINQLIDTHEQIRKMSHDFKHQVKVLFALCRERSYEELYFILSELSENQHTLPVVKTENIMLDAILSAKMEEAEKRGINFKAELNVQPALSYISIDICVLLGNALDNAIEACLRSADERKIIEMDLMATPEKFMLRMKNTVGEAPDPKGDFFNTKKTDTFHHGIGLQSMKKTCEELGGDLTCEYDAKLFKIWLYIPAL